MTKVSEKPRQTKNRPSWMTRANEMRDALRSLGYDVEYHGNLVDIWKIGEGINYGACRAPKEQPLRSWWNWLKGE